MNDFEFVFTACNGCAGVCRVRAFSFGGAPVVILTELAENSGPSVTNALEALCAQLCDALGLDANDAVWIEHYGAAPADGLPERFAAVNFGSIVWRGTWQMRAPRWSALSRAQVEALTGALWMPERE